MFCCFPVLCGTVGTHVLLFSRLCGTVGIHVFVYFPGCVGLLGHPLQTNLRPREVDGIGRRQRVSTGLGVRLQYLNAVILPSQTVSKNTVNVQIKDGLHHLSLWTLSDN